MGLEEWLTMASLSLTGVSAFVIGAGALIPNNAVDGDSFIKHLNELVFRTAKCFGQECSNVCEYLTEHKDDFTGYIRKERF